MTTGLVSTGPFRALPMCIKQKESVREKFTGQVAQAAEKKKL